MGNVLQKIRNFPYYARKAYREGLGWAYAPRQSWLQRAAQVPLNQAQRWSTYFSDKPAPCAWRLSGLSSTGDQSLRVVLLGSVSEEQDLAIDYYQSLLLHDGTIVRENLGPFQGSRFGGSDHLRRKAESLAGEADLVLVAGSPGDLWQPPEGVWRLGPASLRLVVNLPRRVGWNDFLAQLDPDPLITQLRESGWSAYLSHRRDDFARFYRQIYRPTLENHPAEFLQPRSEAAVSALYEQHPLVMLIGDETNGEPVAGALSFRWHGAVRNWLAGVWHGEPALIEQGALAACDYFGLKWAIESGYAQYEAGPCLPFLSDPRFKQKQIWGAETVKDPWQTASLLAWAPPLSHSGLAWLRANPFQPGVGHSGGSGLDGEAAQQRSQPEQLRSQPEQLRSQQEQLRSHPEQLRSQQQLRSQREVQIPNTSAAAVAAPARAQANTDAYHFEVYSNMADSTRRVIRHGLYDHAMKALGPEINRVNKAFAISVQDEHGEVIGGLLGVITWNFLHIDSLWVSPKHRGHDLGTRLLRIAESTVRAEGIQFVTLETTSFEAINFYPRFGYEVVGQVEGIPPGHTLYYLKKKF